MPHLWPPNILEGHFPCCEEHWRHAGMLYWKRYRTQVWVFSIKLYSWLFHFWVFLFSLHPSMTPTLKEYASVIIALRKLVSIQSSVCPNQITSIALWSFKEAQVASAILCYFSLSNKATTQQSLKLPDINSHWPLWQKKFRVYVSFFLLLEKQALWQHYQGQYFPSHQQYHQW